MWYCCCFAQECPKPQSTLVGNLAAQWVVPRETYTCSRPLDFGGGHRCIVETTEMGGGKTEQILQLVAGLPADSAILYVVHRVMIAESIFRRLAGHGFVLCTNGDLQAGPIHEKRIVICVDSLCRVSLG